jgi:hypothetical protein
MKPWNERSGRMWAGMESIVRFGVREGRQARGTVSARSRGIKAMGWEPERRRTARRR